MSNTRAMNRLLTLIVFSAAAIPLDVADGAAQPAAAQLQWVFDTISPVAPRGMVFNRAFITARYGAVYAVGHAVPSYADLRTMSRTPPREMAFHGVFKTAANEPPQLLHKPAINGAFASPLLFVTRDSALHMIWGEADSVASRLVASDVRITASIWHSRFARGEWSTPQFIVGDALWSRPHLNNFQQVGEDGVVAVAMRRGSSSLALIKVGVGGATVTHIGPQLRGGPRGATVIASSTEVLGVAYMSNDTLTRGGRGLFITRAANGGTSWLPPARQDINTSSEVDKLRAVYAGGLAHLFWSEEGGLLHHATSHDGAATWNEVQGSALRGELYDPRVASDACGVLYLTSNDMQRTGARNLFYRMRGDRWERLPPLSFAQLQQEADFSIDERGTIHVAWTAASFADSVVTAQTLRARLVNPTPGCN